jgi:NarL family two-component system response regulator LiaR
LDKISVAIVDDDLVWIKQLNSFLNSQDDIIVIWSATNKDDAVRFARNSQVDFIIMDINLEMDTENYDGIIAVKEILINTNNTKIIMMTNLFQEDVDIIKKSVVAGAIDYKLKKDYMDLPSFIRSSYHQTSPQEIIFKEFSKQVIENELLLKLTASEIQIFNLLAEEYTKEDICKMMYISNGTLKKHIRMIIKKLNVRSIKEALQTYKKQ